MKNSFIVILFILLCTLDVSAQCPFTAVTSSTESRCKESGTITVTMSTAAAYTYQITSGPVTSSVTTNNIFTNLPAGSYTITITFGGCSTTATAVVAGNYVEPGLLTATIKNIACPSGSGCITSAQPTNGRLPYSYSLISGPVTRPAQATREFCGLPAGTYNLQALDSCGVVRTTSVTLVNDTGTFVAFTYGYDLRHANCTDLIVCPLTGFNNTSSHTLIKVWYVKPNGDTLKVNQLENPVPCDTLVGESHTYGTWQMIGYDSCGRVVTSTFSHAAPALSLNYVGQICAGYRLSIVNSWKYGLAVGYRIKKCSDNSVVYNVAQTPPTTYFSQDFDLENGTCYLMEHFNSCGDTVRTTYTTPTRPAFNINACQGTACKQLGKGSISIAEDYATGTKPIVFTIISGPEGVGNTATQTQFASYVYLRDLALGTYKVAAVDACGQKDTIEITLNKPLTRTTTITQTPNCSGGADVHVKITSNFNTCNYPATATSNIVFVDVTSPYQIPQNVVTVAPTATTPGMWEGDLFNVPGGNLFISTYAFADGCAWDTTIVVLPYVAPVLNSVVGYLCTSTGIGTINYSLLGGKPGYRFRIRPQGSTTWGAFQNNTTFAGVNTGIYEINVEDACPNGSITTVSFLPWNKSGISANVTCPTIGGTINLSANPNVNGVGYEWYFNNALIGNGSNLTISNFATSNNGIYKLRQVFPGGTCIDTTSINILDCVTLPNKYTDLVGTANTLGNTINWKSLQEDNATKFYIEHSTNGNTFNTMATLNGQSNSNGSSYEYIHASPFSNINFYRVKFVDLNGAISYSNILKLSINDFKNFAISISPVPFNNEVSIQIKAAKEEMYCIKLIDMMGKEIIQLKKVMQKGINTVWFNEAVKNLPAGIYVFEIANGTKVQREKVVKY